METQQKNKIRGWEAEEKQENTKQQQQQQQSKESVSSAPSSPSHEFSFTISLLSCSSSTTTTTNNKAKSQQQQPPLAIDLTPADDIFFHGHLLPLHLLQNLPASPRSSTNSLPIRELLAGEVKPHNIHSCICSNCTDTRPKRHSFNSYEYNTRRSYTNMNDDDEEEEEFPAKERVKSKSFSLFGRPRRRKQGDSRCEDQNKKKVRFDHVSHFLRKYIALFSKGRIRTEDIQFTKQPFSFSGKLKLTSPANRGVLVAASRVPPPPSSDSTMEELQAAIQAAIAHCKNSIAVAEKLNS